ncbi:hypothetical protein A3K73_01715 [Candidatus Pacearchaeota archaeon RBG_13_36_9]|nr:MAG: hypothetical protein A3K73_01715 [Candidatus Pacearchaeota archaeon RBG_13_36_9]
MAGAKEFVNELKKNKLGPIYEVPCSIFKDLINYLIDSGEIEFVNPANEAIAMAQAAGSFIATKQIPIVMMQNSGLNNTLNCLTSLNKQYGIPVVYLISWRGEGKDAPEHNFMGEKLKEILNTYEIRYRVLTQDYAKEIEWAKTLSEQMMQPTALIMREGFINKYGTQEKTEEFLMDRWEAIETIVDNAGEAAYISTNGFPSRQAHNILKLKGKEDGRLFGMVGSMGHALGIGLEEARKVPKAKIIVLDGDGGALMQLGAMASVAKYKPANLVHVILDNQAYGSTGNQPCMSKNIDFVQIGEGFGYKVYSCQTKEQLKEATVAALQQGPALIHVSINQNELSKDDSRMGRVEHSCTAIKERHEKYLERFK